MPYRARQQRLLELAESAGVDAWLISSPENVRWLSGFTGSNGQIWIAPESCLLLTDGRYRAQAAAEARGVDEVVVYDTFAVALAGLPSRAGVRIGVEREHVTLARRETWGQTLPHAEWLAPAEPLRNLRATKDAGEVEAIREAVRRAEEAFADVEGVIRPGRKEREIALELEWAIRRQGAARLPFEIIAASGPRSALPHGTATDRQIWAGDALTLDFGAEADGYFSDMTFAGSVGSADAWVGEITAVLVEAQAAALAVCRPGVPARDIDAAARRVIEQAGYGDAFPHSLGHGVGLAVHEPPTLSARSEDVLEAGMVVTIEPGIYVPERGGARLEDMVRITDDGAEKLTTRHKHGMVWALQD